MGKKPVGSGNKGIYGYLMKVAEAALSGLMPKLVNKQTTTTYYLCDLFVRVIPGIIFAVFFALFAIDMQIDILPAIILGLGFPSGWLFTGLFMGFIVGPGLRALFMLEKTVWYVIRACLSMVAGPFAFVSGVIRDIYKLFF